MRCMISLLFGGRVRRVGWKLIDRPGPYQPTPRGRAIMLSSDKARRRDAMAETLNPVRRLFGGASPDAAGNRLPDRMISADSHIVEPPHAYARYIDPAFRDRAPKIVKDRAGGD